MGQHGATGETRRQCPSVQLPPGGSLVGESCQSTRDASNNSVRRAGDCALPDDEHFPAKGLEIGGLSVITTLSSPELGHPELAIGLGHLRPAAGALVPKAPVNEDRQLSSNEGDIRSARNPNQVHAIASKASSSQCRSKRELWSCVPMSIRAHRVKGICARGTGK